MSPDICCVTFNTVFRRRDPRRLSCQVKVARKKVAREVGRLSMVSSMLRGTLETLPVVLTVSVPVGFSLSLLAKRQNPLGNEGVPESC